MKGFYDSLTIFAMECIPKLANVGVERVGNKFPGIVNWKIGSRSSFTSLVATVFKQVICSTIINYLTVRLFVVSG